MVALIGSNPAAISCSACGLYQRSGTVLTLFNESSAIPLPVFLKIAGMGSDITRTILEPQSHILISFLLDTGNISSPSALHWLQRKLYIGILFILAGATGNLQTGTLYDACTLAYRAISFRVTFNFVFSHCDLHEILVGGY